MQRVALCVQGLAESPASERYDMTAKTLQAIQRAISEKAEYRSDLLKEVARGHSPTLWLALEECGFPINDLKAYSVRAAEQLAAENLGLSMTHCALIRVGDWTETFGGVAFLDPHLSRLGPTAISLRNFWFHLDTLKYPAWREIAARTGNAPPEWRQAWIRAAQAASTALPDHYYSAGQAAVEVAHEPAADIMAACVFAKHRATIEILAAATPDIGALNYLSAFGFQSLGDIPQPDSLASTEPPPAQKTGPA